MVAHEHEFHIGFEPQIARTKVIKPLFKSKSVHGLRFDGCMVGLEYVKDSMPHLDFVVKSCYQTKHNGMTHLYLRQTINGLEVANGDVNVNIDRFGRISSVGSSVYTGPVPKNIPVARMSALSAIQSIASYLKVSMDNGVKHIKSFDNGRRELFTGSKVSQQEIPVKLMYIQNDKAELELVWNVELKTEHHWVDSFVSTERSELVAVYDWEHGAVYNVYPIGVNDPSDGSRTLVTDPHLQSTGSPLGWHDQGTARFSSTIGNNVYAQENFDGGSSWQNNYRPSSDSLNFDFPINFNREPAEYIDAAVTNLFFWNNICHDVFYEYGFDEVSGNFQENNFGNGGLGSDAVQANAQDGSGYNNANFATPVDGQRPRMRMYLWNWDTPMLDGDLDNGIIIHEYAHGLSNRLTGGPANSNCLGSGEAGGMGEGWGDCLSLVMRWRSTYTKNTQFEMGEWAAGYGIRLYPYAYSMTANPQTYSSINGAQYSGVHAKGCAWCTVLYDLYLNLIERYGFDPNHYAGKGGNNYFLQLVIDGMKLQPCRPTFIDARDAIIEADEQNYNGSNYCLIWQTFARRGLGTGATSGTRVTDSFAVPAGC